MFLYTKLLGYFCMLKYSQNQEFIWVSKGMRVLKNLDRITPPPLLEELFFAATLSHYKDLKFQFKIKIIEITPI